MKYTKKQKNVFIDKIIIFIFICMLGFFIIRAYPSLFNEFSADSDVQRIIISQEPINTIFLDGVTNKLDGYHPFLYYVILHFFSAISIQEWVVRLPAFIFGISFFIVFFIFVRSKFGSIAALLTTILAISVGDITDNLFLVEDVTLFFLSSILVIASFNEYIIKNNKKFRVLFFLFNILLVYSSLFFIVIIIPELIVLLFRYRSFFNNKTNIIFGLLCFLICIPILHQIIDASILHPNFTESVRLNSSNWGVLEKPPAILFFIRLWTNYKILAISLVTSILLFIFSKKKDSIIISILLIMLSSIFTLSIMNNRIRLKETYFIVLYLFSVIFCSYLFSFLDYYLKKVKHKLILLFYYFIILILLIVIFFINIPIIKGGPSFSVGPKELIDYVVLNSDKSNLLVFEPYWPFRLYVYYYVNYNKDDFKNFIKICDANISLGCTYNNVTLMSLLKPGASSNTVNDYNKFNKIDKTFWYVYDFPNKLIYDKLNNSCIFYQQFSGSKLFLCER